MDSRLRGNEERRVFGQTLYGIRMDSRLRGNEDPSTFSDKLLRGNEEPTAFSDSLLRGIDKPETLLGNDKLDTFRTSFEYPT